MQESRKRVEKADQRLKELEAVAEAVKKAGGKFTIVLDDAAGVARKSTDEGRTATNINSGNRMVLK